jgi:hypothetical protein
MMTLARGNYTAILCGPNNTTGVAVEVLRFAVRRWFGFDMIGPRG